MYGYKPLIVTEKSRKDAMFGNSVGKLSGVLRGLGWMRYMIAAMLLLAMVYYLRPGNSEEEHGESVLISCGRTQPLVKVYPNFLPGEIFRIMHTELPNHPLIGGNQLDEENFAGSQGFLVKFNLEGLNMLRANKLFSNLLPYVDSVLNPHSNAFVFNLLVSVPSQPGKLAVGVHLDDTVALYRGEEDEGNEETLLAHQVNVLYTNLPPGMEGGELEAWNLKYDDDAFGRAVVRPTENTMVEFRGDSYHRVLGFSSPSGANRISLVFEQYRVSPEVYSRTVTYCENQQCGEVEALSVDDMNKNS